MTYIYVRTQMINNNVSAMTYNIKVVNNQIEIFAITKILMLLTFKHYL